MKIAVLGSAPSSIQRAPFKNSAYDEFVEGRSREMMIRAHGQVPGDWDIWGCSPACWAVIPRATRWFEVHRWEPNEPWFGPEYTDFLVNFKGPIYTGGAVPEIQNHVLYPIDRMEEKFSSYFMTSSLALMLALAIDTIEQIREARRRVKAEREAQPPVVNGYNPLPAGINASELDKSDEDDIIGMWGVDMGATEEYSYQRPGCQFFVLEAMRRGIAVYLPPESDIMRPMPVYGISEWDHNYIKLTARSRELSGKGQRAQAALEQAKTDLLTAQGGMGELNCFVNTWTSPYGMRHGMVIRQEPGTGLGGGITHLDGRPLSRPLDAAKANPVMDAISQDPDSALGRELQARLAEYSKATGKDHGGPVVTLERLLTEARVARRNTSILQDFCLPGESSEDTLLRIINVAKATPSAVITSVHKAPKRAAMKGKRRS